MKPSTPENESERIETLKTYRILDSPPEADFDDLVNVAAAVCEAPIALISLVDAERQWFKARLGLETTETPRDHSFCAHAILKDETMIVPDTTCDERFIDNPLVLNYPHMRFYAGAPLRTAKGHGLGTLCVIDTKPRVDIFNKRQVEVIEALSRQAVLLLELRRTGFELADALSQVKNAERQRSETLAFVSHDLRSPMVSLLALVNRCQLEPAELPTLLMLESVEKYARRNLDASDEFLQLARAEGSEEIAFYDVELGAVAQNAIDAVYSQALERHVQFELTVRCDNSDDGIWIRGNGDLLERAVINLLVNSVKYGPSDASVTVTVMRSERHDRIDVRDLGSGVLDNERDDIFKPYYRSRSRRGEPEVGSGLGLALVKAVAERHGGSVEVDSPSGGGALFTILLPRI